MAGPGRRLAALPMLVLAPTLVGVLMVVLSGGITVLAERVARSLSPDRVPFTVDLQGRLFFGLLFLSALLARPLGRWYGRLRGPAAADVAVATWPLLGLGVSVPVLLFLGGLWWAYDYASVIGPVLLGVSSWAAVLWATDRAVRALRGRGRSRPGRLAWWVRPAGVLLACDLGVAGVGLMPLAGPDGDIDRSRLLLWFPELVLAPLMPLDLGAWPDTTFLVNDSLGGVPQMLVATALFGAAARSAAVERHRTAATGVRARPSVEA